MGRGGYRPGAGRPRGSKDRVPRPRKPPAPETLVRENLYAALRSLEDSGEFAERLRYFMHHPDDRIGYTAFRDSLDRLFGKSREAPTAAPHDAESVLREIWVEREARAELDAPPALPPAPSRAISGEHIAPPLRVEPAPPTQGSGDDVYRVPVQRETVGDDGRKTVVIPLHKLWQQ